MGGQLWGPRLVGRGPGSSAHPAGHHRWPRGQFTDLDDHGYIDMLFVDPDFGRHGVASELLASVVALARQRGLPALTTFASLTSRPVFEKQGFVITGERYFGEGDRAAKTYAMRCVLAGTTAP